MDMAIRDLIIKLRPYKLTKAEVVMILNLGLGVPSGDSGAPAENGVANGDGMDVDEAQTNGDGEEHEEEEGEDDGGAMALFDTVIEEREGRISDEDVVTILGIIRETLNENYGNQWKWVMFWWCVLYSILISRGWYLKFNALLQILEYPYAN